MNRRNLRVRHICAVVLAILVTLCAPSLLAKSLEYELALSNAKGYISEHDISVRRFAALLRQLNATFPESEEEIANISVNVVKILDKDGIDQSLLELMEGMNRILSHPVKNQKYVEYAAVYTGGRRGGYSHAECIDAQRALVRGLGIDEE